ncbi:DUF2076 domain-containing protein [Methylocaldum sp.]|uniref:DUF2076 domain-containing protein n=1 Tax=Methylocaldum sp. TaxID=1969727 RepID=UPI002D4DC927|nr:DUF2076 domain-containing protein [Methylocaldum sp.]HYE36402.1 DUF2076 domain-containing protein [Methylocaldum sp.]
MHTEERRLLTDFLDQLKQVKGSGKDPEADTLINQAVAQQPDATYLLVQKALLQEQALNAAKAQIAQLQNQINQLQSKSSQGGGFLGTDPWNASPSRAAPVPPAGGPPASPHAPNMAGPSAGMSFLGTAAATAAGIAGGAFLFQGIESLLHHGSGGGFLDSASTTPENVENITINEYYNTDEPAADPGFEQADFDDSSEGFDDYDNDGSLDV